MKAQFKRFIKTSQADPKPGDAVIIPTIAKNFLNGVTLDTKREFAGKPGTDYDPTYYAKNFWDNTRSIRYGKPGEAPVSNFMGDIKLDPAEPLWDRYSSLIHELTHFQNRDNTLTGYGRSPLEDRILRLAYGFTTGDVENSGVPMPTKSMAQTALDEQATTNREYRFRIYRDLVNKLHRWPTYDEFKNHITTMPDEDIDRIFREYPNSYVRSAEQRYSPRRAALIKKLQDMGKQGLQGSPEYQRLYQQYKGPSLSKERIEAIRNAWLRVASNRNYNQNQKVAEVSMNKFDRSYVNSFVKACSARGVDPIRLVKYAQTRVPPTIDPVINEVPRDTAGRVMTATDFGKKRISWQGVGSYKSMARRKRELMSKYLNRNTNEQ